MMDTSEKYIKMCEKATEIQEGKSDTWFPRQDQLQEMLDLKRYSNEDILEVALDWAMWLQRETTEHWEVIRQYESMEQLWLAFVMYEKYRQKVWNGEDWVAKELIPLNG